MLFHAARFEARTDAQGRLLLLEDQDRAKWNQDLIARARWFLDQSAEGKTISTSHLEAGNAMLHSTAPSFAQTQWPAILRLYDLLVSMQPSAIYQLNRAIVLAHLEGSGRRNPCHRVARQRSLAPPLPSCRCDPGRTLPARRRHGSCPHAPGAGPCRNPVGLRARAARPSPRRLLGRYEAMICGKREDVPEALTMEPP
jgi:hypothetical protein